MTPRPLLLRLIAFLVLAAFVSAPFADAVAMSADAAGMARMIGTDAAGMGMPGMPGMPMADMPREGAGEAKPCCLDAAPRTAPGCDKSACPSMASCTQQCVPASVFPEAAAVERPGCRSLGMPPAGTFLASLEAEPPARPPRA